MILMGGDLAGRRHQQIATHNRLGCYRPFLAVIRPDLAARPSSA
jgi:formaldehyde-activating enzyme involved in methanogenesis